LTRYRVPQTLLRRTFDQVRACGASRRECQVLWTSRWDAVPDLDDLVHPRHRSYSGGLEVESAWITEFWKALARERRGVRVQVHTHPGSAFHSASDDTWPVIHVPGFLSLVIPRFGFGRVGLDETYLTQIGPDGTWHEVVIAEYLEVVG